ncbi:UNVERIFIED_CONTAM: hypothetical protein QE387_002670 [Pseudacidovorax intermedius]|nr:hypothetical protein [Pseudacidovorax intermedius]
MKRTITLAIIINTEAIRGNLGLASVSAVYLIV